MEQRFESEGLTLAAHLALPERLRDRGTPALILLHGFPDAAVGAIGAGASYPALADRIAEELGWVVMAFNYRGCGQSEGDFSVIGWRQDVRSAVDYLRDTQHLAGVWLAGFGTGGALAVCAAAEDPDVRGVATLAAPADFAGWAAGADKLVVHARKLGAISTEGFPEDFDAWSAEFDEVRAAEAAPDLVPRNLLVVHGALDEVVSPFDARIIADSHGDAELRMIASSDHRLRYDPRAVAVLLGWLRRQR